MTDRAPSPPLASRRVLGGSRCRPRAVVALAVATSLLLGACGDDPDDVEVSAPTDTSTSTTAAGGSDTTGGTSTTTTTAPFDGTTGPVEASYEGTEIAHLTDVRVGHHEGFDRVVFEFRTESVPGYRISYVEPPIREDGSGNEVEVDGRHFVEVRMNPASAYDLEADEPVYEGPQSFTAAETGTVVIAEVTDVGDFEAYLTWAVGLRSEVPFRVTALEGPARLVIDFQVA